MSSFKQYFLWRLKGSALRTVIFTLLSLMLIIPSVSESVELPTWIGQHWHDVYANSSTGIEYLAILLGILCTLIPILELAGFKNRRNIDTLYFLPIRREKMAAAHFVGGFVQIIFIYTVNFLASVALIAFTSNWFDLKYMIPYYFLSLLVGLGIYSIFSFVFTQANTVSDGVLFCIAWAVIAYVVIATVQNSIIIENSPDSWRLQEWGLVYQPINSLTMIYQDLIEFRRVSAHGAQTYAIYAREHVYLFFIWGAAGIASAVGYFITFVKKGAQNAGEISDSPFGFKILIPILSYSALILTTDSIISYALYIALTVIAYVVYRRGFKFKKSDVICMIGTVPVAIIASIIERAVNQNFLTDY